MKTELDNWSKSGRKSSSSISPIAPETRSDALQFLEAQKLHPALQLLFNSAVEKLVDEIDAKNFLERLERIGTSGTLVYLQYNVDLDVLNKKGDIRVTYSLEVSNFSMNAVSSVEYPFWFECPQKKFDFFCLDENLKQLPFEIVEGTPNFQKVRIYFPEDINPLAKKGFSVSYLQEGNPLSEGFYFYLRPRAITSKLGLSILAPTGSEFLRQHVMRESTDGYLRDDPPATVISRQGVRWKMCWEHPKPRPGEMFRTYWSCGTQQLAMRSSSEVILFRPKGNSLCKL